MNLRVQLQEWSHSFQTLALKKHIHFVLEVNDDRADYLMAVDAEKMERIYFNLLSNAVNHYGYTFYFDEGGRWEICASGSC